MQKKSYASSQKDGLLKVYILRIIIPIFFVLGLSGPTVAHAATTPSLGVATTYGVLGSTYTNPLGPTTVNGDVGFTTGPAVAPLGVHPNYGSGVPYATAGIDQGIALTNLNNQVCTPAFTFGSATDLSLLSQPLAPGVYCVTGAMSIGSGGITLTGAGTYIFRSTGALNTVASSIVTLSPGVSACDVFWTPTATTLGANSIFAGTDIDDSGITILSTVTWLGRALAFASTVTTPNSNVVITTPTCATPPPTPVSSTSGGGGSFVPLPLINITKVPYPSILPLGPGSVTYTYTTTNIGKIAMNNVWVKDDKCSPVEFISGDTNNDSKLDMNEVWIYHCTKTVVQTETNTATAHGWSNGWDGYDTAKAIVVVNSTSTPVVTSTTTPVVASIPIVGQVLGITTSNVPSFPNTGLGPNEDSGTPWKTIIPTGIFTILFLSYLVQIEKFKATRAKQ